uniref:F-box domain-containing protein n=1 Tax=Syphacia muris TaxID=451379 RepID=A0A0N5AQG9_9BILA
MTNKTEHDFPEEFLEMLGYMLPQRERERLRAVSTRWNEAIKRIPPTENIHIKSVSVQDNMISVETARVSQYFFRNDKMLFFNISPNYIKMDKVFSRKAFYIFASKVRSLKKLWIIIHKCHEVSNLCEVFMEACPHWIIPKVSVKSSCAAPEVCRFLSLFSHHLVKVNFHKRQKNTCAARSCDHFLHYTEQAHTFQRFLGTLISVQDLSVPIKLLSVPVTYEADQVIKNLKVLDVIIVDDGKLEESDWIPDAIEAYVVNYNVRFCVDGNVVRVTSFEQMKAFTKRFEKRMDEILFGNKDPAERSAYLTESKCSILLHMLGKSLDISYRAVDYRERGWNLLVMVTPSFDAQRR